MVKKYTDTTKEQDRDGASPLVSLEEVINVIKRYSADNDDMENVWRTCEDLIGLIGFTCSSNLKEPSK